MKWSDGEPMTADDVKYTIDRANDEAVEQPRQHHRQPDGDGRRSRNTLVITSSVPDPRCRCWTSTSSPSTSTRRSPPTTAQLHRRRQGRRWPVHDRRGRKREFTRLVRNPNWYGKKPAIDDVIFRFFADAERRVPGAAERRDRRRRRRARAVYADIENSDTIAAIAGNQGGFSELSMNSGCSSAPATVTRR